MIADFIFMIRFKKSLVMMAANFLRRGTHSKVFVEFRQVLAKKIVNLLG